MPIPSPALAPAPALFDVTILTETGIDGTLARVPLDELELAENPRRTISPDGIERLAGMLMRLGQLAPCLGWRPAPERLARIYDGQRRLLAAQASAQFAGSAGFEGLAPVRSLIVLLLDHEPGREEILRIQAQANRSEELALVDQQAQFGDCWQARAGLPEADRIAAVCADLGISAKKAHNLRRQLTLPEAIRARVAERPTGHQLSVTLANRLADMHEIAPALTEAVATRVTSSELHDGALRDLGAFVHRTLVEDERAYAVRIDDGALLDGVEQIARARAQLTGADRRQLAGILDCPAEQLERELDALTARARTTAMKLRVDGALRERARTGRYAYVHERGADFAAGVWVIDPVFMLDAIREQLEAGDGTVAREQSYFAGAGLQHPELRAAGEQDRAQRADARARQIEATRSNLGLGHDLRAGLIDPTDAQLQALKAIVCHLLARHQRELIAYGAGWSDRERQQPVGDSGRHEPRHADAIADAELQRALEDPDPLRAIAGLVASWSAAFVLDPDGVTRTKALGSERMARRLRDALPGGEHPLRASVWEFLRPMLSPRLAELHRDAFVIDDGPRSSVDLAAHRGESSLQELDLGEPDADAA
jgi:hypothetical protein